MARNIVWAVLLTALVISAPSARADYEAGQRAWEAGRADVALTEWRSAAASGDRRAMLALGRLFVQGLGAPQDYVEAHKWLNLAASRGEVAAVQERDALAAKMSAEQVATAQARATAWRPDAAETGGPVAPPAAADVAPPAEQTPAQTAAAADSPPPASPPSKEAIREAQELLAALGYAPGPADGMWGQRSARAYKAFLQDAGLPTAGVLNTETLQAMRDKADAQRESKKAIASAGASEETSQASVSSPTPTRSTGEVVAAMAEIAIQGLQAYMLVKLMEDPENIARVAPELQKLLGKMVSGLSAADLSNKDNAPISLGALTTTERGRLSDLLKKDQGLPKQTRVALSGALRAKAAVPAVALKAKCAGAAKGTQCWKDVANKPGCRVWDDYYVPGQTVTWSGACSGGVADGQGTLKWAGGTETYTDTGTLSNGKKHGRWVLRLSDGRVDEGPYEDGKRHGKWVVRYGNGTVAEGPYEEGKRHGGWVVRFAKGGSAEGPYEDGKRHGGWVERFAKGGGAEGPYEEGKRHGKWVVRFSSGMIYERSYKHGKKHGKWVERWPDGDVDEYHYKDGKMHRSVLRKAGGNVFEFTYKDGKKHGRWVRRFSRGAVLEGFYKDGEKHGREVVRSREGRVVQERHYKDGERHGRWVERSRGLVEEGYYKDGERHGRWVQRFVGDGLVAEGHYKDGKKHGPWISRWSDGTVMEAFFVDGEVKHK